MNDSQQSLAPWFKFVLGFSDPEAPAAVGCYVWENEHWSLLFGEDPNQLHGAPPSPAARSGCLGVLLVGLGLGLGAVTAAWLARPS